MIQEDAIEKLPCLLSEDELRQRGEELARMVGERDDLEAERAAASKEAKDTIGRLELRLAQLASEVRARTVYRDVTVHAVANFQTKALEWIRLDTGEVVRQRPLSFEELQLGFDFGERPGDEAASRPEKAVRVASMAELEDEPDPNPEPLAEEALEPDQDTTDPQAEE